MIIMTKLNHLRKTISSLVDDVDSDLVYVLTSGGLDSQSIIFSALEVGKQVVIVSFTTQGHESRDFKSAKKIAMKLDLLFLPVIIPTDLETIKRDSYTLGNELECRTKSEYECTHPMIYAYDVISQHADGKAYILSGLGADCFYVLSKKGKIHYSHRPDEFRYMTFNKENYCQRRQHVILEEKYNCVMVTPYLTDDIYNLFEGTTWDECNRPKQKNHVRENSMQTN